MTKLYLLTIAFLFGQAVAWSQFLNPPASNQEAGIYESEISLELFHELEGVSIFYTINGDEPTVADYLYTGPINLGTIPTTPDVFSVIPTNPSLVYPFGTYSTGRANSRGWAPPYTNGYKVNVIRYRAFKPGFAPSKTITQTFIVDPEGTDLYSTPIISIAMDYTDIFSDEEGIYVYGDHEDGNYEQKGADWERIMSLEYFQEDGSLVFVQDCRTRIHGGGSRHAPKKSFRVYAETGDISNFTYQFFDDSEISKFKRILLKAGGHRPDCFPRDDLANMITKGINVEQQHFKHVIVFINGEYWGIHSVKERMDKYMIQNLYGIDDNEITLLDQEFDVQNGHPADSAKMKNLENFIIGSDMTEDVNYQYVADRIDIDNYIDYMCAEIFLSNEDWVYSNVNIWRRTGDYRPELEPGYDGKFRWAVYDLDGAFGGSCANAFYTVNTLAAATIESGTFSSYSRFFRGMLENERFKIKFINRMSDLSNSWFKSEMLHEKMDSIYNMITPEIYENAVRWRYPSFASNLEDRYEEVPSIDRWDELFDLLHIFAQRRPRKVREHIMEKWGYADTNKLTVDVNDMEMGRVQVNSILINQNLPGTSDALYPWIGDYIDGVSLPLIAVPLPGYRFVEWEETGETNDTMMWNPDGDASYTAVFEENPDYQKIRINEVMLSNDEYLEDNFGDHDDWSELFNPNDYAINISGMKLMRQGEAWTIQNGTLIAPNGYLLFWHDKETYQGDNHVDFKLTNSVDTLFLLDANDEIADFVRYPVTPTDESYGRYPNGSNTFSYFTYPTPLQNNDIAGVEDEVTILTPLNAFPNPASAGVQLNKKVDFQLYDLNGRLVMKKTQAIEFNVATLNSGTYILKSSDGETLKIIVQ